MAGRCRGPFWRWVRRVASILVTVAVVDYVVLPQLAGTRQALGLLAHLRPGWALLAVVFEAASMLGYSMMTRSVLPPDHRPRYGWLLRSDLVALGVSHVVPGGAATATGVRFRLQHEGGARADDVTVGITWQAIESTVVLVGLLWAALVISIPFAGFDPAYVTAAVVGAVVIAVAVAGATRHRPDDGPAVAPSWLRSRIPGRYRERATSSVDEILARFHDVLANHRGLRVSAGWSTSSWVFDAASLGVLLAAFGHAIDPVRLLVAYGIATSSRSCPSRPGASASSRGC
jgi:uncharacterized membrane protein YbhN (UPF0104 family)